MAAGLPVKGVDGVNGARANQLKLPMQPVGPLPSKETRITCCPAGSRKAGEIIVRGIEKRRARILVGRDAVLISLIERLMPVNYWRVLGQRLRS